MKKELLHELYYRPEFRAMVAMSLAKEVAYLAGKETQTDEEQAIMAAYMAPTGSDIMIEKVCKFVIDDAAITALGCYHELSDEIVGAAVTSVFNSKRKYLV